MIGAAVAHFGRLDILHNNAAAIETVDGGLTNTIPIAADFRDWAASEAAKA